MASRQTVASVARVCSAALVRLPQRRALAVIGSAGTKTSTRHAFSQPLTPSGFARTSPRAVGARAYSQSAQNKIWSFEDVQNLTKDAKPAVVLIDAREPGELEQTGRIPGSINIPITSSPDSFHIKAEDFEDRFGFPPPDKDAEVVFYCKAGVRSRAAAGLAKDAGWTNVAEYPGSWVDWVGKGGKIQR